MEKEKEDAVSERNTYWEDILRQKQQEHEESLSTKVKKAPQNLSRGSIFKLLEMLFPITYVIDTNLF